MKITAMTFATALLAAYPAAADVAKGTVKIGVLTDMGGPYADNVGPGSVLAAKMAVEDFGGKAGGLPIEVIAADHQNKPDIALNIARRWYDTEGVDTIVDVVNSAVAAAVQQLSKEKRKILLITGSGSPDLTGKLCSPFGVQWAFDNYALANVTAAPLVQQGLKSWFFLTVDYSFGYALEAEAKKVIEANGGTFVGSARHPIGSSDFSSYLLQAQASKAQVVALANGGADMTTGVKQAIEFGLTASGQKMVALLVNLSDINSLGLNNAQGLTFADSFYWDLTEETRTWSKRFMARFNGKPPGSLQAAVYGAVTHYLKAIDAKKSDDGAVIIEEMRRTPINDFYTKGGTIRADGRVLRNMYLLQVKRPEESKYAWDYYTTLAVVPGEKAFRPLQEGQCPLVDAKKG